MSTKKLPNTFKRPFQFGLEYSLQFCHNSRNVISVIVLQDLPAEIRKTAKFLGKHVTKEQVTKIADHCSFSNMKNNKSVNYTWMKDKGLFNEKGDFMRKGVYLGLYPFFREDLHLFTNVLALLFKYNMRIETSIALTANAASVNMTLL